MARVFLDANIFLYATGGEGPHRQFCPAVLRAVAEGALDGATSTEVLQEILHVRARRFGRAAAGTAVRAASALVADVLPVRREDVRAACDLLNRHPQFGARDAGHVGVMINAQIPVLVSVDQDFDVLNTVRRVSPEAALGLGGV